MRRVVIKSGIFKLSPIAIRRIAELLGKECFFFSWDNKQKYVPIKDDSEYTWTTYAFSVPNPNDYGTTLTELAIPTFPSRRRTDRENPILVQVVSELGEKAGYGHCRLAVCNIPSNIKYEIQSSGDDEEEIVSTSIWSMDGKKRSICR